MIIEFSDRPGRHERHLQRRHNNPLFALPPRSTNTEALVAAGHKDDVERETFLEGFKQVVEEAVALKPNEDAEVILSLKERLDKAYEEAAGLGGDLTPIQEAIRQLVEVIMGAVRKGAGNDALAHQELDDEEQARAAHFELLATPLVADLLHPETLITPEELVPALLSADENALAAALTLFDADQIAVMVNDARRLLAQVELAGHNVSDPRARLTQMEAWLMEITPN
ncbi:MAG TPA: hypothetical protein EYH07_07895 [Kiloniellaceae bacterium]|nr:hypothetical protein [Kiloniellaceae bacterium]